MSQNWDRLAAILAAAAAMPKAEAAAFVEREIAKLHEDIARRVFKVTSEPNQASLSKPHLPPRR